MLELNSFERCSFRSRIGHFQCTLDDFQILTILKQRETTDMKTVLTDFEPYNSSVSNGSS